MYQKLFRILVFLLSLSQCSLSFFFFPPPPPPGPVVILNPVSKIRGTYMPGYRINKFEAFLGIPYAKPPVGNLRFANPVFADPSFKTIDATIPRPECIQKNYLLTPPVTSGEEDCLYLNIYRPVRTSPFKPLPVMVYIYGGGYFSGTANPLITGPEYFMDTQKVILVTLYYRVGALGFLSTGDDSCPGNFALKDQAMALRWVNKYIGKFGGRNDAVTIFGQSAGAASVHMHMLNQKPNEPALFQRAIVMSGSAAAPYNNPVENPLKVARQQAEYTGVPNAESLTTKELVEALRSLNALDIVEAGDKFKYWHVDPLTFFRPVIEQNASGAFLTQDPKEIMKTGSYHHIPWMITFVPYEGAVRTLSILSNETLVNEFNENFNELLIRLMEIPHSSTEERDWYVQKMVDQYMNGERKLTKETAQGFGDMIGGRAFVQPMNFSIEQYVKYADVRKNPLYLTKFNYRGTYSYSYLFAGNFENYGVVHCDDLIYLLHSPLLQFTFDQSSPDARMSAALVESFITFAIKGRPKKYTRIEPCSRKGKFCEYHEFRNSEEPSGFEVVASNEHDESETSFWNDLIKY